tara:strand:+ start:3511 stop:5787 length:2277 start_codon:yes stop_codon:yes gene_type:complete
MANLITELFVSLDGLEFNRVELHGDESLNLKYTKKDLQDLSKIFAPFSQGFQFPATPKNRASFGFFGDTDVIKVNAESRFPAKIYTGGILNQTGFIKLEGVTYVNHKPVDFSGSFASNMTNLKDRIGDDYLSDITDEAVSVPWSFEGVQNMVRSNQIQTVDGVSVKYFVPLISINRVWGYDLTDNSDLLDNIAYNATTPLDSNNLIKPSELRPVLYYSSIMEFIKKKYNLNIISPLENRQEYKDLVVWCNSERISNAEFSRLPVLNDFSPRQVYDARNTDGIPNDKKYILTADTAANTINIFKSQSAEATRNEWVQDAIQFRVKFNGVSITGDNAETPSVNIRYIRASNDVTILTQNFELTGNTFDCVSQLEDYLWGSDLNLEFYIEVQFMQPTSWAGCDLRGFWRYYDGRTGFFSRRVYAWFYQDSLLNNNSVLISTDRVDLIKSLPKIKVVDFLSSHFKTFNISVFDTSPDSSELFWLTPEDILSRDNVYSKAVLDYTGYIDAESYNKEKPNDYNYYNFKHATSEYFSNKKYLEAFDLEYGQTVFPEVIPEDPNSFKVETNFSIIPPVTVNGAAGLITAYGFTDAEPELTENGASRYTPNYDELTVFYSHGSTPCATLGYNGIRTTQSAGGSFNVGRGVYPLTGFMKVTPVNRNGFSLGFSVLIVEGTEYLNSLFLRYYEDQTKQLLDPNVLSQTFDLTLPASEIYLNDSATSGGLGVPSGFRLQNDIIIGENLFTILEATIDITTGKAKIKFLNY